MVLPAFVLPVASAIAGGLASGAAGSFFQGSPEKRDNVSLLRKEQEPLYRQAINAGMRPGAGGAFGESADFYRNWLNGGQNDQQNYNDLSAPILRQYNQDIVPGLSEQFAGMGAGGLSSSGFRNAQIQGATDLAERLGSLRAQLRQHGDTMRFNAAQGLTGIGQQGLQNYSQNMTTQQGTPGFLSEAASGVGKAATQAFTDWYNRPQAQPDAGSGYNAGYNAGMPS